MTGHIIMGRPERAAAPYKRRTVEDMTDAELKRKVCKDVKGGCQECAAVRQCRYGAEYLKRKRVANETAVLQLP